MSKREFHKRLFEFMHREPFLPFAVKLRDGSEILIKQGPVVWDDGAASFIDPQEEALVDFYHNHVKEFVLLEQETPA